MSSTDGSILDDHEFIGKVEREGTRWDSDSDVYCVNNLLACLSVARIAGQSFARQTIVFLDLSSGEIVAVSVLTTSNLISHMELRNADTIHKGSRLRDHSIPIP